MTFDSNVNELRNLRLETEEIQSLSDDRHFRDVFVETSHIGDGSGDIYTDFDWADNEQLKYGIVAHIITPIEKYCGKTTAIKIVDVGCGNGFTSVAMSSVLEHSKVIAIDPSPDVMVVNGKHQIRAFQGTLQSVSLEESSADVGVIIGNFMLHTDPVDTLSELKRVLKPGALIIIDFKNVRSSLRLAITTLTKLGLNGILPKFVVQRAFINMRYGFHEKPFERIVSECGLKIMEKYSKPPRLLEFENSHSLSNGLKGFVWRLLDWIDKIRDQRAWVQYVLQVEK